MRFLSKLKITLSILLGLLIVYVFFFTPIRYQLNADFAESFLKPFGSWAPVLYIIIFALCVPLLLSSTIFVLIGGALFGVFPGSLYAICGAVLGASISFGLARFLGEEFVERMLRSKKWSYLNEYERALEKRTFFTVLIIRLIPFSGFVVMNYLLGTTRIKFRSYFFGTLIGEFPIVLFYAYLGKSLLSYGFFTILGVATGVFLLGIFYTIFRRKRREKKEKILKIKRKLG